MRPRKLDSEEFRCRYARLTPIRSSGCHAHLQEILFAALIALIAYRFLPNGMSRRSKKNAARVTNPRRVLIAARNASQQKTPFRRFLASDIDPSPKWFIAR